MSSNNKVKSNFKRRQARVRYQLKSKTKNPRLSVFFSNGHIYAQVIDDLTGVTLVNTSTLKLNLKGANKENAIKVGAEISSLAEKAKVKEIVFDRGGNLYHGKVKELADSARKGGLKF